MEVDFQIKDVSFVWDSAKAAAHHPRITFENAATVFLDPFLQTVDASQNGQARRAAIGFDSISRVLFVVYVMDGSRIRIISARKATSQEKKLI